MTRPFKSLQEINCQNVKKKLCAFKYSYMLLTKRVRFALNTRSGGKADRNGEIPGSRKLIARSVSYAEKILKYCEFFFFDRPIRRILTDFR